MQYTFVYRPGSVAGYDESTGVAHEFPRLRDLLAEVAPSWRPGDTLVLMSFSAGTWALRYYLRDPETRADATAVVTLDGTYGTESGCDLSPFDGLVEYAKLANQSPGSKRLVMTYSHATAGPGFCAHAIASAAGDGEGVIVVEYANADHPAQETVAAPEVLAVDVTPWLPRSLPWGWLLLAGAAAWAIARFMR
jgi:hypothetical protein